MKVYFSAKIVTVGLFYQRSKLLGGYLAKILKSLSIKAIRGCPHIKSAAITRQGQEECFQTLT